MGDVRKGLRTVRNVVHNYNDAQVKVREATSNDPWGPAASLMSDISDMTYNHLAFSDIMQMLWKRMNDSGKDWRHVYKALVVLDYIIKSGTEKVAQHCKENLYFIQTLTNFQHMEENKDLGMNVREKAKQVVALLTDEERLKNERVKASKTRERFQYSGNAGVRDQYPADEPFTGTVDPTRFASLDGGGSSPGANKLNAELEQVRPQNMTEEEIQLQIALAMSKEEADEEERRRQRDDMRLQLALQESQTDFQKQRPVQVSSQDELFDVFHQPAAEHKRPGGGDPWGASDGGFGGGGFDDGFGGNGFVESSSRSDPWGAPPVPAQSAFGNGFSPANSPPKPTFTHPSPPVAASLDPWSQLTPTSASNPLSISPTTMAQPKKPTSTSPAVDFLGQNSNLVNLDSLVTLPSRPQPPVPTSAFALNPFGGPLTAPTGNNAPSVPNPFHAAAAPPPTINQLRQGGQPPNPYDPLSTLPAPLVPSSGGGMGMGSSSRVGQNNNNNYNPFL
ncbi:epsin-2-like [Paramacrobiotus metropolitanus]|uniref:epsin-2-like n=1 Tax=Paramacrobiotus metropolitanus TaxID=2943436 RepID=UPI002445D69B|nr:epsin-2-like [Paramacrobiotus metropolitanus]